MALPRLIYVGEGFLHGESYYDVTCGLNIKSNKLLVRRDGLFFRRGVILVRRGACFVRREASLVRRGDVIPT